jgi:4-hydroxy-tetrahydrodipicolinate synthase
VSEGKAPPGIICALITPIAADQSPDLGAFGQVVDFQLEKGTHGLFPLGTTGEGPLLQPDERKRVAEFAVQRAAGRVPVIVHCGAPDTKTVSELARHAQDIGADAVAVVAPFYFRYGEEALYRHFATVAEAAPGIDHYVYQNPETVGYSLEVDLVLRLVDEVANIRGVKDTGDSIARITSYLARHGPAPEVYAGNNSIIFQALSTGARGAVSALANAVPELVVALYEAWDEGRLDESLSLQFTLNRLQTSLKGVPYVAAVKYLVERRGLPGGGTRAPQLPLAPGEVELVERRLQAALDLHPWLEPVQRRAPARRP